MDSSFAHALDIKKRLQFK